MTIHFRYIACFMRGCFQCDGAEKARSLASFLLFIWFIHWNSIILVEWHSECQTNVLTSCNLLLGTRLDVNIDGIWFSREHKIKENTACYCCWRAFISHSRTLAFYLSKAWDVFSLRTTPDGHIDPKGQKKVFDNWDIWGQMISIPASVLYYSLVFRFSSLRSL